MKTSTLMIDPVNGNGIQFSKDMEKNTPEFSRQKLDIPFDECDVERCPLSLSTLHFEWDSSHLFQKRAQQPALA